MTMILIMPSVTINRHIKTKLSFIASYACNEFIFNDYIPTEKRKYRSDS